VSPGDLVTVPVDVVVLLDTNFMPNRWVEVLRVADPERIVVVFDHRVPAMNPPSAIAMQTGRDFVQRFGIKRFHDVGYTQGISHQLVADHAYALPGSILIGSDSHTGSGGVFNCLARGVGPPDVVYAAVTGNTWFAVGETVRSELEGKLPRAVTMKDAFLHIAGRYGDHVTMNVEFGGPGMKDLGINARKTMTTMATEIAAEFATFEADDVMAEWLRQRTDAPLECISPDADAKYADVRRVDLSSLQPLVAFPDAVIENSQPVEKAAGMRIDQAFVGSCANGTLDDLELAASVVKGRKVKTRFIVTPASQTIYREASRRGLVDTLLEAGAVVTHASCGACASLHSGVLGPGETCITASTRNFKGRMGDPSARIFMASPATVAASALTGVITDPREFLA
jgi:3-isopropylmalate/(R)-2-methylmalate dehydratase large subunit